MMLRHVEAALFEWPVTHRAAWVVAATACIAGTALVAGTVDDASTVKILAFWGVLALAIVTGWQLTSALGLTSALDRALATALTSLGLVILCAMIAGAAGHLSATAVFSGQAVAALAALLVPPRTPRNILCDDPRTVPVPVVAIVSALMAFAVAFAAWHAPLTLYDSVSYHLFFAGRWVQDQAVTIIPTPFSDVAQAYAPGNGELWFAWLMLPFHGDVVARIGQLPFALLGAAALFGVARQLGVPSAHASYPPAFWLLARPVVEQMVGADVDLVCAAFFTCAVYFALAAIERDSRSDWTLFGLSAGLYAGTKYVALVYLPILVLLACARGLRVRALWALPGLIVFGASWYLRNWVVAGSPVYPASLAVAGVTIARGAFDRAAMFNTVFHTNDLHMVPALAAQAFGPPLFVVWLPLAVVGWVRMARQGWWPFGALAALPLAMLPFYWFGLPVNVDTRFLLPAIGPALLPLAFVFVSDRRWNLVVHAIFTSAMLWVIVGSHASLPGGPLPWFAEGWLELNGLVPWPFLIWLGLTALLIGTIWLALRQRPGLVVPMLVLTFSMVTTVATLGANRWCGAGTACEYLDTASPFIRDGYLLSWQWIRDNVRGATIAYTGVNLPYPLTGRQLSNRVVYANIDGRVRWRFDDYDRAYRAGRFSPRPPMLAISSGELMPVADRVGSRQDALRPRYERMDGNREAWLFNLETLHVRYLYVAMLSAYEIDYQWHDDGGFPIENQWAQSDPQHFRLAYRNPQVRIYEFAQAMDGN